MSSTLTVPLSVVGTCNTFMEDIPPEDLERDVQAFAFVCTNAVGTESDKDPCYHWRIFMVLVDEPPLTSRSVKLDISPKVMDGTAILRATSKPYDVPNNRVVPPVEMPAQKGTVGQIIQHLLYNGRDKYIFHGSSMGPYRGCRFWCEVVADDLERAGYIEQGGYRQITEKMNSIAQLDLRMAAPAVQGRFYQAPVTLLNHSPDYNLADSIPS
ncbi:hypothetical protein BU17DRAFT_99203 [Hysterangium stoloniferum]|nr:hypothetical protein BU17DRAFT_99203 [Hysterangium stoloniferum]